MKGILAEYGSSLMSIVTPCITVCTGILYMSTNKLSFFCFMCVFPGGVWLHSLADALASYQNH